jgi:hypothetical protein
MNKSRLTSLVLILALIFPGSAAAQGIPVSVTVGLDGSTRDLLDRLPKEIHDQIIASLQDAMPIIDKSVVSYLAKINEILDHQINHAQCSLTGVVAEVDRRIKLPLTRQKGPLELFDEFEKSELGRVKQSTTAASYAKIYGDIFYDATVTYCEMQISGSVISVIEPENKYRKLTFMWFRLKDSCGTAIDCLQKQRAITKTFLENNDKRDVQSVDATNRLSAVPQPAAPGFFSSFDPAPFESALSQLLAIQDQVSLAKLMRVLSEAQARLPEADAEIASAKVALQPIPEFGCWHNITQQQVDTAKSHANGAGRVLNEIDKSLSDHLTAAETHQGEETQSIRSALDSRRSQVDDINKAQPKRWQAPSPCQLH